MCDDRGEDLLAAGRRVASYRQLNQAHVEAEDELSQQTHRLENLEAEARFADEQIARLEGTGLMSLLSSLVSDRQGQLDRLRAARTEIEREQAASRNAVASIQTRLEDLRKNIAELGDAEADYARLFRSTEQEVIGRGDEWTEQLEAASHALSAAEEEVRRTEWAAEAGDCVMHRLAGMSSAFDRARKKQIYAHRAPGISAVWNSLQRGGATPFVTRVREGLERLHRKLADLRLSDGTHSDIEIIRLTESVRQFSEDVAGGWAAARVYEYGAAHPIENEIRFLLSHLHDRLDDQRRKVRALEQDRREIIERFSEHTAQSVEGQAGMVDWQS